MQVYLVGGAVRDELLGRSVGERDWVVVGATPEELLRQGYRPAGRDFPVFLHPESNEEYALARLERKTGPGYRGFATEFSPAVTLIEDLRRRDLTINAMARAADGELIDPYGGREDLARRVLRHVSEAFAEDPVRILRVARFAACFAPLGFTVAPQTMALMRQMVAAGEADTLVSERVWRELERALGESQPAHFFEVLAECGALAIVMPELAMQPGAGMLPGDLAALSHAAAASASLPVRFAALLASLSEAQVAALCMRVRAPNEFRELALLAARMGECLPVGDAARELARTDAGGILRILEFAGAFRRPERFAQWLQVCEHRVAAAGASPAPLAVQLSRLRAALATAAAVRLSAAELAALKGTELGVALRARRLAALEDIIARHAPD